MEYPLELAGATIDCPQCNGATVLPSAILPVAEADGADELPNQGWTVRDTQEGWSDRIRLPWTSPAYLLALFLVAAFMILLPIVYLLFIGGVGYGVWEWADRGRFLFSGKVGGFYGALIRITLYIAPLVAGAITLFFMVKPLLARARRRAQPLALNPAAEPVLYTFVQEIARQVGSPLPSRIDLDCQLNASAGFRRGFASLLSSNLVLTLGLPLVAGLSARELAGVVGHELGHFRQGLALRLSYIIRGINGWFARVIYQRDAWDEALEGPATALFSCFDVPARQVTYLHYTEDLRLPIRSGALTPLSAGSD